MERTEVFLTEADRYVFGKGTHYEIYEKLGAHEAERDGIKGIYFAVWAPAAQCVQVVGDFNNWDGAGYEMTRLGESGIFELFTDKAQLGSMYKYLITARDGRKLYKADPYGNYCQVRPETASIVTSLDGFRWDDASWICEQNKLVHEKQPISIYEVHPGSWKKKDDGTEDGFLNYRELADELSEYVRDMGYTHIELLPVMEYPYDPSWGYQITCYYAPTHRYGAPEDLKYFIDEAHRAGIGVILDWVPAHFPKDANGLYEFDGTCCYELSDPTMNEHPDWTTRIYDYGKPEVRSFLISNACYWISQFHADGIRVDAVASMLYLDYNRPNYKPNRFGGRENLEAIDFLRQLNAAAFQTEPAVMMIAEESTAFPLITKPDYDGGLGFLFKWNMGWMNDILSYIKLDPVYRKYHHDKLTFSLFYAFSENYILPFSHDEVVHGKHSMLDKNPGDLWQKFAGLRALYGYTMAHPGKKLLFMGGEFAHFIEWKYDDQLDWFLLVYERHAPLQSCVRQMNHLYREIPALHEVDNSWNGFQWITANDTDNSVVAFIRTDKAGQAVLCVSNFTPVFHPIYRIGLPLGGTLNEIFNTDRKEYGGSNQYNAYELHAEKSEFNGFPYSVDICVPPLSTVYFRYDKLLPPPKPRRNYRTLSKITVSRRHSP